MNMRVCSVYECITWISAKVQQSNHRIERLRTVLGLLKGTCFPVALVRPMPLRRGSRLRLK